MSPFRTAMHAFISMHGANDESEDDDDEDEEGKAEA